MASFAKNIKGDKVIWTVVLLLSVFSILAVYSSTGLLAYRKQGGNTEYYLVKQLIILMFGWLLMYLTHLIKYTYFSRISQIGLILCIPLLLVTLISGTNYNEANRWLTVPILNVTFQSSDIAKLFLIMYLARVLSKKQEMVMDFRKGFLPVIVPAIIICALILPANFSTAAILFVTCMVVMFIGRISFKYIVSLVVLGVFAIILIFGLSQIAPTLFPRGETWMGRVEHFIDKKEADPDATYQVTQAKIAVVSGGILGKSPGKSTQRNFLPHPYSDFIFAIIIEEYGLIGGSFVLLLYLILFFRVIRIANKCQGNFGTLLSVGIGFSLVFQALINMAVAVNLFPVTGQPLPLISMGGTSIWFTCISIGIILSVSRRTEIETKDGTEIDILKEAQPVTAQV
ncbi:MAG TPA: putative peptidoglycan glycosyltransferase FtsW [Bacteroidales bacterium]|nr:putative peptidoglycan glycosyltransferase FtsW [Bacteroidales bacterium]HPS74520.1 putative peptidoglycan glycosyltransferase FtsW [Bacteroidales bacterium]